MKAYLILEDGTVFEGVHIGADREVISEIVFNTSMAGYLEILTDPSYAGQAVCMTYPLIGNYGICRDDMESLRPWPDGFIVRELSRIPSNFRSDDTIQQFLEENNVPGIAGIDTRALTKILREKGTMNGMITSDEHYRLEEILPKLSGYAAGKVVEKVSCGEKYVVRASKALSDNGPLSGTARFQQEEYARGVREKKPSLVKELNGYGLRVALMDYGAKRSIAASLAARGCEVTVYPAWTAAEEVIADAPDGIMLSNGPGDPKECARIIEEIKKLYRTDIPIFAICLGHQLMALANGGDTYKMKYGHRGGNHPVKDLATGRVYISSQNHGYVVDAEHMDASVAVPAFVNVNDGTNEGLRYIGKNIFTVQFHPEACPGPQDSGYLFDRFIEMMRRKTGLKEACALPGTENSRDGAGAQEAARQISGAGAWETASQISGTEAREAARQISGAGAREAASQISGAGAREAASQISGAGAREAASQKDAVGTWPDGCEDSQGGGIENA